MATLGRLGCRAGAGAVGTPAVTSLASAPSPSATFALVPFSTLPLTSVRTLFMCPLAPVPVLSRRPRSRRLAGSYKTVRRRPSMARRGIGITRCWPPPEAARCLIPTSPLFRAPRGLHPPPSLRIVNLTDARLLTHFLLNLLTTSRLLSLTILPLLPLTPRLRLKPEKVVACLLLSGRSHSVVSPVCTVA